LEIPMKKRDGLFSVALSVVPAPEDWNRNASDSQSTLPCGVRTFLSFQQC
jgi:hypothetical protein